ncbi:hypothetical protein D3C87_88530 [compost metagenome]
MSQISSKTSKTSVKILFNILVIAGMVTFSPYTEAQSSKKDKDKDSKSRSSGTNNDDLLEDEPTTRAERESMRSENTCIRLESDLREANRRLGESCSKAGTRNCVEAAKKCSAEGGNEDTDTVSQILPGILGAVGGQQYAGRGGSFAPGQGCPQWSGKDYFEKKKEYDKDVQEAEKDLVQLTKDQAKAKKEFDEKIQDIQKKVNEAQADLKKKENDIEKDTMERLAQAQESQSQNAANLRKKGTEILEIKSRITNSNRDKAKKLIALSEASGKRECMKNVRKARADYVNVSANTSSTHIAQGDAKRQDLLAIFLDCTAIFEQERVSLNENKRQELEALNKQLADVEEEIKAINDSMALAQSQLDKINTMAADEKTQAQQELMKMMQLSQQEMVSAQESLQKELAAIAQEQQSLQKRIQTANTALSQLGPVPKSPSSTSSLSDVADTIEADAQEITDIKTTLLEKCPLAKNVKKKYESEVRGTH